MAWNLKPGDEFSPTWDKDANIIRADYEVIQSAFKVWSRHFHLQLLAVVPCTEGDILQEDIICFTCSMFICHPFHWVTPLFVDYREGKKSVGFYWSLQKFKQLQTVLPQSMPLLAKRAFDFTISSQPSVPQLFKHSSRYLDLFTFHLIFPKAMLPSGNWNHVYHNLKWDGELAIM